MLNKSDRVLILYERLKQGERIRKELFMDEFSVGRRSFDRYIETIRLMLSETFAPHELLYDAADCSYYLSGEKREKLRGVNVLPIVLLLFGSRVLGESDIVSVLHGLFANLPSEDRKHLEKTIIRIKEENVGTQDTPSLLKMLWDLNLVIERKQKIHLFLTDGREFDSVQPLELVFSNGRFHLKGAGETGKAKEYSLTAIRYFTPL